MGFITIRVIDIIDIALVAILMYYCYKLIRGTRATNIMTGILLIYAMWILVRALNMELLTTILGSIISVGIIALIVIFQPEIRHFLEVLGDKWKTENRLVRIFFPRQNMGDNAAIEQIAQACKEMSARRTGALIVLERHNDLKEVIATGVETDAIVSAPLLMNIFFKNSPLHDGAVVVSGNRIVAAKCILPSTQREVPFSFGMRHRAAVGMSEVFDALVVVVSEETGCISIAKEGKIECNIPPHALVEEINFKMNETTEHKPKNNTPEKNAPDMDTIEDGASK